MKNLTIEDAETKIENALMQAGPFTYNMVGMVLASVAKNHGVKEANRLIDEFDLELMGIRKEQEQ